MAEDNQAPAAAAEAEVAIAPAEVEKPELKRPATVEQKKEEEEEKEVSASTEEAPAAEATEEVTIPQSISFKEESNVVADLIDPEKKALDELKQLIQAALANNEFTKPLPPPPKEEEKPEEKHADKPEEAAKDEEPAAEKAEEPVVEKAEEAAKVETLATTKEEEPSKAEEEVVAPPPPAEEPAPVAAIEEEKKDVVVVDDDGAKTVEAIEETVISIAAAAPETEEATAATAAPAEATETTEETDPPPEEIFIWGVPLVGGEEKSDTILLKFLRARDFKVKDALAMIKDTVIWRKEFGIEELLEEDLGVAELEKVVFMHGQDKEGHPVCYNVYGEFQDKELYQKAFGDEEKRKNFLRWRVQFLEKGIRQQLNFSPDGVCTMVQVTDLKNSLGPLKKELRQATNQALTLLQDNYPEFVAKQVFINVPWWYLALNRMISPFLTQRSKSKFVFAGPSKTSETLFKYIAPEQVPVQYGGLSMENDSDFSTSDAVTEVVIKPSSKHTIEIPVTETCTLVWDLRVLGWEVSHGAEFMPDAEGGYTVIVQKTRKFIASDEPVVKNSFKIGESGKIVLTVDNATSKKKKLLYRSKTKVSTDLI